MTKLRFIVQGNHIHCISAPSSAFSFLTSSTEPMVTSSEKQSSNIQICMQPVAAADWCSCRTWRGFKLSSRRQENKQRTNLFTGIRDISRLLWHETTKNNACNKDDLCSSLYVHSLQNDLLCVEWDAEPYTPT